VRDIVEKERNRVYTCAVTIAEVVSKFIRRGKDPAIAYHAITSDSIILDVDRELSRAAGAKHAEVRRRVRDFGLADAYVLACSARHQATIVTGDPHFAQIPDTLMI
jgi:predicted nucleic acid-binding protein